MPVVEVKSIVTKYVNAEAQGLQCKHGEFESVRLGLGAAEELLRHRCRLGDITQRQVGRQSQRDRPVLSVGPVAALFRYVPQVKRHKGVGAGRKVKDCVGRVSLQLDRVHCLYLDEGAKELKLEWTPSCRVLAVTVDVEADAAGFTIVRLVEHLAKLEVYLKEVAEARICFAGRGELPASTSCCQAP